MEKSILELAKALAEAYLNGYKDALKDNGINAVVIERKPQEPIIKLPETTSSNGKGRYHATKPKSKRKGYRDGKATTLIDEDNRKYTFKSRVDASFFLGRSHSYITNCIKKNWAVFSNDGKEYLIEESVG